MLQLKLKEPYDQVFVRLSLENPSTGVRNIVDAKIDTGATVTLIPMSMVSNMGFEIIGEEDFVAANGGSIHAYVALANVTLSEEDSFEIPIYICQTSREIALVGMDILQLCNYSQWHETTADGPAIFFKIESAEC